MEEQEVAGWIVEQEYAPEDILEETEEGLQLALQRRGRALKARRFIQKYRKILERFASHGQAAAADGLHFKGSAAEEKSMGVAPSPTTPTTPTTPRVPMVKEGGQWKYLSKTRQIKEIQRSTESLESRLETCVNHHLQTSVLNIGSKRPYKDGQGRFCLPKETLELFLKTAYKLRFGVSLEEQMKECLKARGLLWHRSFLRNIQKYFKNVIRQNDDDDDFVIASAGSPKFRRKESEFLSSKLTGAERQNLMMEIQEAQTACESKRDLILNKRIEEAGLGRKHLMALMLEYKSLLDFRKKSFNVGGPGRQMFFNANVDFQEISTAVFHALLKNNEFEHALEYCKQACPSIISSKTKEEKVLLVLQKCLQLCGLAAENKHTISTLENRLLVQLQGPLEFPAPEMKSASDRRSDRSRAFQLATAMLKVWHGPGQLAFFQKGKELSKALQTHRRFLLACALFGHFDVFRGYAAKMDMPLYKNPKLREPAMTFVRNIPSIALLFWLRHDLGQDVSAKQQAECIRINIIKTQMSRYIRKNIGVEYGVAMNILENYLQPLITHNDSNASPPPPTLPLSSSSSLSQKLHHIDNTKLLRDFGAFPALMDFVVSFGYQHRHKFLPDAIALAYHMKCQKILPPHFPEGTIIFHLIRYGMVDPKEMLTHFQVLNQRMREKYQVCIDMGYRLRMNEIHKLGYKNGNLPDGIEVKSKYFGIKLYNTDAKTYKDAAGVLQEYENSTGKVESSAASVSTGF